MSIVTITLKIPERQKDFLLSMKEKTGLNMSEYTRRLYDKEIEKEDEREQ